MQMNGQNNMMSPHQGGLDMSAFQAATRLFETSSNVYAEYQVP